MFGFLGFLLILFLLIVIIGFSILGNILRLIFGFGRRNGNTTQNRTYTNQRQQTYNDATNDTTSNQSSRSDASSQTHSNVSGGNKKKIFDDNDGEYVDYEEVKDK